jgi:uroporphyrinogen decarboxylase
VTSERDNYLRAVQFRSPEWIPASVSFAYLTWHIYRERLEAVVKSHPLLFPDYSRDSWDDFPAVYREGEYFRDNWGCLWYNAIGGLEGQVVESPLADWDALESYRPPDPATRTERGERDWAEERRKIEEQRREGRLVTGDGGRLFDRLYFLRGFQNLMEDFATNDPHLSRLIDLLTEYELDIVKRWLDIGVDMMGFHTDIGTQHGLMVSPAQFRRYVKPMFRTIFGECRRRGVLVYLSSDGRLLEIVDDLIDCGVSVHDPQARANTLEGIAKHYRGRLCANVDLDRQMFAFAKPGEIRRHVEEAVERMYLPEGGLMVSGSVWDGNTPLENIEELCEAIDGICLEGRRPAEA